MIYPKKLEKNDFIAIISPSNGIKSNKIIIFEKAIYNLKQFGFQIIEDNNVRKSENGVSSSAQNRVKELQRLVKVSKVKALIACSGGDYLIQILDLINFKIFRNNIKWIQGKSDITPLLFYLTTKLDIATIYSFNAKTFGEADLPKAMITNNIDILQGKKIVQKEFSKWECITNDKDFEGRIIGGCLDSLKDIIGTKYDVVKSFIKKYSSDGVIWYFDVAEMTNEDILRTLWQLKNAGWFKCVKGLLFGKVEEVSYTNLSLKEAIKDSLNDLNIPIIINVDIGHTNPLITIVNGSLVKIKKKDNQYFLEMIFE